MPGRLYVQASVENAAGRGEGNMAWATQRET